MRNRPDSRGRLTGLQPPRSQEPDVGGADPGGRPDDDPRDDDARYDEVFDGDPRDDDARYGDAFDGGPVASRPVGSRVGGWVPDVATLITPVGRARTPGAPGQRPVRRVGSAERTLQPEPADWPAVDDAATVPEAGHGARRVRYSPHHAWGRVAQRWIPEPLRDARVDPGRRGALLLTVVAAVAALVAAVGVWRDQPEPRPVQAVSLAQVSTAAGVTTTGRAAGSTRPATALATTGIAGRSGSEGDPSGAGIASTPSTTDSEVLIVSVTGAVRHPGLVRLPPGSRVADAIARAGGATAAADLTGVNLAARLADGASVVVSDESAGAGSSVSGLGSGVAADSTPATSRAGQPAGKVDLNTADAATLDALPGVGPVTAAAIVAWRDKNGKYTSVEQLQEIQGIGPAKYAALAPLVTV